MGERLPENATEPGDVDEAPISVLHVDDDPDFLTLAETYLTRESDRIEVVSETDARTALDRLTDEPIDCVVSDYDMPGVDGLDFLERLRERDPDAPFVLFTGKGSEEIASRAVSAGVTDYIQKGGGAEQYELLANRIENAVDSARARAAAERGRKRLRSLTEAFPDLAFYIDAEGRYLDVLAGPERSLLYDEAESLVGERFHDVLPEPTADRFLATVERALSSGELQSIEYDLEVQEGQRWFEARVAPLESAPGAEEAVVWVARDITDRRRHEETIGYERDRLAAIFRTVPEPLVHIEFSDGDPVVVRVNEAFEEVFGHERDAAVGESLNELIVPESQREEAAALDEQAREAGAIQAEVRRLAADGERTFRFSAAPVVQRDDRLEWVATYVDVSEERRRREELERQTERLQEFASFVSHDLQNPLMVARGSLELVADECDSDRLADVAAAHDRMETLIEHLVQLVEDGERVTDLESIALPEIVDRAWRSVETEDADLVVRTDATVRADPGRVQRILENIFRNAVQHGTGDADEPAALTVTVEELEERSGFAVADDGVGIPADSRDEVFETGYSTAADGTGFGLAIVDQIADAHGWTVRATESNAGGARIEVAGVTVADD